MGIITRKIKGKSVFKPNAVLAEKLIGLRQRVVENPKRTLTFGRYISGAGNLNWEYYNNFHFGFFEDWATNKPGIGRHVAVVYSRDYRFNDLPEQDLEDIFATVFQYLLLDQQKPVAIKNQGPSAILFIQEFALDAYLVERNPSLVSIAGGVNLDKDGKVIQ